MFQTLKEHPYLTGGAIIAGAIVVYLLFNGGAPAPRSVNTSGSDVGAATDALNMQLQAQAQSQQISGAIQANADNNASAIELAKIGAGITSEANNLQYGVNIASIDADLQKTTYVSALQASVAQAGITAQTQQAQIASNTTIATTQAVTGALVAQSAQQAAVAQQAIAAANQCHGIGCWF